MGARWSRRPSVLCGSSEDVQDPTPPSRGVPEHLAGPRDPVCHLALPLFYDLRWMCLLGGRAKDVCYGRPPVSLFLVDRVSVRPSSALSGAYRRVGGAGSCPFRRGFFQPSLLGPPLAPSHSGGVRDESVEWEGGTRHAKAFCFGHRCRLPPPPSLGSALKGPSRRCPGTPSLVEGGGVVGDERGSSRNPGVSLLPLCRRTPPRSGSVLLRYPGPPVPGALVLRPSALPAPTHPPPELVTHPLLPPSTPPLISESPPVLSTSCCQWPHVSPPQ